jgi:hypothetical protein
VLQFTYAFRLAIPSSRTMALGLTKPLTEMSTRNIPEVKGRPTRNTDKLSTFCEPIVEKIWEPRHLTTLWASTACYGVSFTLWRRSVLLVWYELDCKYCYK